MRRAGIPQMIGMMIESNLSEGKQSLGSDLSALTYGVSVTDGCVGWNETVAMLEEAYDAV
jgi:3-deoxy-7-phosphoheptulonate synthase